MSDGGSDDDLDRPVVVYTAAQILYRGLRLVHYKRRRIRRAGRKRNIERFKGHFGAKPHVLAQIWEDLQITDVEEARLLPVDAKLDKFLMAFHMLRKYPTELEREPIFDIDPQQGRDWVWFFLEKIVALKSEKIRWPDDDFGNDIWVMTVDGTHVWITEPGHPDWSQDSRYFSHKYGKAGVNYELGISLSTNRLVWMNRPHPAGESDLQVFIRHGLRRKLKRLKKRSIGDGGYPGHSRYVSTPNNMDSKEVKKFKSRALKRHENFNGMTKTFECLSGRFHHSLDRFKTCFEAVCVVCQYQLELGNPLYDILIAGVFGD